MGSSLGAIIEERNTTSHYMKRKKIAPNKIIKRGTIVGYLG